MVDCKRCGQCCFYINKNGVKHKCRYLARLGVIGGKTACRIYGKHLGVMVSEGLFCIERKHDSRRFEDCPLNH